MIFKVKSIQLFLNVCISIFDLTVYSWGGGSRGQLGHGTLSSEEKPRLVSALDGMRVSKIAAGGWHSAIISQFDDLYMFGWNESGQLAQPTNLTKPAECFSAVEKLLMSCCTMQSEDAALPRGDADDCEVYHKNDEKESSSVYEASEIEKVWHELHVTGQSWGLPKGQLILKWFWGVIDFLQKTNERIQLIAMITQVDLFSFVFWRKSTTPKNPEIN